MTAACCTVVRADGELLSYDDDTRNESCLPEHALCYAMNLTCCQGTCQEHVCKPSRANKKHKQGVRVTDMVLVIVGACVAGAVVGGVGACAVRRYRASRDHVLSESSWPLTA